MEKFLDTSLNTILFYGFVIGIIVNIAFTDYKIATKRDILQLFVSFIVVLFFWYVTEYMIPIKSSEVTFYKLGQGFIFFLVGWLNVEVLLFIVKEGKPALFSWIANIVKKFSSKEETK